MSKFVVQLISETPPLQTFVVVHVAPFQVEVHGASSKALLAEGPTLETSAELRASSGPKTPNLIMKFPAVDQSQGPKILSMVAPPAAAKSVITLLDRARQQHNLQRSPGSKRQPLEDPRPSLESPGKEAPPPPRASRDSTAQLNSTNPQASNALEWAQSQLFRPTSPAKAPPNLQAASSNAKGSSFLGTNTHPPTSSAEASEAPPGRERASSSSSTSLGCASVDKKIVGAPDLDPAKPSLPPGPKDVPVSHAPSASAGTGAQTVPRSGFEDLPSGSANGTSPEAPGLWEVPAPAAVKTRSTTKGAVRRIETAPVSLVAAPRAPTAPKAQPAPLAGTGAKGANRSSSGSSDAVPPAPKHKPPPPPPRARPPPPPPTPTSVPPTNVAASDPPPPRAAAASSVSLGLVQGRPGVPVAGYGSGVGSAKVAGREISRARPKSMDGARGQSLATPPRGNAAVLVAGVGREHTDAPGAGGGTPGGNFEAIAGSTVAQPLSTKPRASSQDVNSGKVQAQGFRRHASVSNYGATNPLVPSPAKQDRVAEGGASAARSPTKLGAVSTGRRISGQWQHAVGQVLSRTLNPMTRTPDTSPGAKAAAKGKAESPFSQMSPKDGIAEPVGMVRAASQPMLDSLCTTEEADSIPSKSPLQRSITIAQDVPIDASESCEEEASSEEIARLAAKIQEVEKWLASGAPASTNSPWHQFKATWRVLEAFEAVKRSKSSALSTGTADDKPSLCMLESPDSAPNASASTSHRQTKDPVVTQQNGTDADVERERLKQENAELRRELERVAAAASERDAQLAHQTHVLDEQAMKIRRLELVVEAGGCSTSKAKAVAQQEADIAQQNTAQLRLMLEDRARAMQREAEQAALIASLQEQLHFLETTHETVVDQLAQRMHSLEADLLRVQSQTSATLAVPKRSPAMLALRALLAWHMRTTAVPDHPVMAELSESVRALLSQVATHRRRETVLKEENARIHRRASVVACDSEPAPVPTYEPRSHKKRFSGAPGAPKLGLGLGLTPSRTMNWDKYSRKQRPQPLFKWPPFELASPPSVGLWMGSDTDTASGGSDDDSFHGFRSGSEGSSRLHVVGVNA